jgi:plastocyanin
VLLHALSTGHKLGLGLAGAAFAGFAVVVSMAVPRRWPQFPGRKLWLFLIVCVLFFFGMLAAVEIFGKASEGEAAAAGQKVTVGEVEYKIQLPKTTFAAGKYTFEVDNKGKIPHNLTITGPGISKEATQDISAGSSSSLTVKLERGTYDFYCSIPGHKQQGMEQKVTVS